MATRGARGGGHNSSRNSGHGSEDRNTSQSQSNVESRPSSVRGSNVLEQVPNNPSKRKFIDVESDNEFTDHEKVIRDITCTLKSMFGGPWATWKMVDKDSRDALWQQFRGKYDWPEESNALVHKVWVTCMKGRFSDTMRRAREASVVLAQAANVPASLEGDLTLLKDYHPDWIKKEYWVKMIDEVWNTPKWKRISQSGKENRNKLEDGSVSKHCGGSISVQQHRKRMEANLKRRPTGIEVYAKLHTRKSTQEYVTPKAAKVKIARLCPKKMNLDECNLYQKDNIGLWPIVMGRPSHLRGHGFKSQ